MRNFYFFAILSLALFSCKSETEKEPVPQVVWEANDETAELEEQALHENERMRFKLINSRFLDKNTIWNSFDVELANFSAKIQPKMGKLTFRRLSFYAEIESG